MNGDRNLPCLLPQPQSIQFRGKDSQLSTRLLADLAPTRKQLSLLPDCIELVKAQLTTGPDSYRLDIEDKKVTVSASTATGWHCGLMTLKQLAQTSGEGLQQLTIEDWPDFENRAVMLDVSRSKVPTQETLHYLIDRFSEWKINQLQLYIEHTFAFRGHDVVWKGASPFTEFDIQILDTYCQERFIELVPNINCFGHMHRWLKHDHYRHLAENPQGGETDFGFREEPQGLCPIDPGSIELAEDIIRQTIAIFKSRQINVGCDETIDLGYGRSKAQVKKIGRGRVYLNYLKQVFQICHDSGHTVQFWADILLKYPELIEEIPGKCIPLNWGYEAKHPFEKETKVLRQCGKPFYVCPGTSSWNSIGGRTTNMLENIRQASLHGKAQNAIGLMITDWGDNDHLQPLVSSMPGLAFGANQAWNQNKQLPLELALDQFVFRATGWGKLLLEIGDLDQAMNVHIHNRSILYDLLLEEPDQILTRTDLSLETLDRTLNQAIEIKSRLKTLSSANSTEPLYQKELNWVIDMLIHASIRGQRILNKHPVLSEKENALALRAMHKEIWDARNQPGGYRDSRARFQILITR